MRQNPHVRICGGPGSATTLVYPTARRRQRTLMLVGYPEAGRLPTDSRTRTRRA